MFEDIKELVRVRKDRSKVVLSKGDAVSVDEDACLVFFVVKPGTDEYLVEKRIVDFQKANDDVFEGGRFYHLGSRANARVLVKSLEKALGLSQKARYDGEVDK